VEQAELFRAIVDICLLIIAAEIATTIGVKLKLPRIMGPLIAGIIFGPYLLGGIIIGNAPVIEYNELIFVFGEMYQYSKQSTPASESPS
jgi:Kef-type K+ transport system membrane component KefB